MQLRSIISKEINSISNNQGDISKTYFEITKKSFKCSTCGKLFKEKGNLKIHKRIHNGERPYVCNFEGCNKSFVTLGNLKSHFSNHSGDKQYKCTYEGCKEKYYSYSRLRTHERLHTDYRPYECPWEGCGKKFNEKGNLKTHYRIHTGEKPFKCTYQDCAKAFKAKGHLKDHLKIHLNKAYYCTLCNLTFTRSSELKFHQYTHINQIISPSINEECGVKFSEAEKKQNHFKESSELEEIFEMNGTSTGFEKEEEKSINSGVTQSQKHSNIIRISINDKNEKLSHDYNSPIIEENKNLNLKTNNNFNNFPTSYPTTQTQIPIFLNINEDYLTTYYIKFILDRTQDINFVSMLINLSLTTSVPINNLLSLVIKYINDLQSINNIKIQQILQFLIINSNNVNSFKPNISNESMNM